MLHGPSELVLHWTGGFIQGFWRRLRYSRTPFDSSRPHYRHTTLPGSRWRLRHWCLFPRASAMKQRCSPGTFSAPATFAPETLAFRSSNQVRWESAVSATRAASGQLSAQGLRVSRRRQCVFRRNTKAPPSPPCPIDRLSGGGDRSRPRGPPGRRFGHGLPHRRPGARARPCGGSPGGGQEPGSGANRHFQLRRRGDRQVGTA